MRRVEVCKHQRQLRLLVDGVEQLRTQIVSGRNPADKEREGDLATPEGQFYVCYKNPASKYHRFLGLSYPNREDADRGLRQGLISQAEHDQICAAIAAGQCPPWKTPLGGEVGIHGPSPNVTWTHGCIALTPPEIELLFDCLQIGDEVLIRP